MGKNGIIYNKGNIRKRMKFHWKHQDMESNTLSKFSFFFPPFRMHARVLENFPIRFKAITPQSCKF